MSQDAEGEAVHLSYEERQALGDVIDFHVQGQIDAKGLTVLDRTLPSIDHLMEVTADIDHEVSLLKRIREKLK